MDNLFVPRLSVSGGFGLIEVMRRRDKCACEFRISILCLLNKRLFKAFVLIASSLTVIPSRVALMAQTKPATQVPPEQTSASDGWEAAAGGKMAFDVASVRQNKSGGKSYSNVKLNNLRQAYAPNGGVFVARNWNLVEYMVFSYKLSIQQANIMIPSLPRWAVMDLFDIEAKSENHNPTKDQVRLMLQALLEDRFQLAGHMETRQLPVLGLVLVKPQRTGPQLRPHSAASICPSTTLVSSAMSASIEAILNGWPPNCGHVNGIGNARSLRLAGRNVSIGQLADALTNNGEEIVNRVVVDQTGLSGNFDFVMDFDKEPFHVTDDSVATARQDETARQEVTVPTLVEAMRDQLGLKLVKKTAAVDCFVVDHVERPSAN